MDDNIKVIKSKELSEQFEPRYIVVDTETGGVLDDANGYGYKTVQKAYAGYAYKSRSRKEVNDIRNKEAVIFKWLKEHKDMDKELEASAFYGLKDGVSMTAKDVAKLLETNGYKNLPFTAAELLRCWNRGKPQYGKNRH